MSSSDVKSNSLDGFVFAAGERVNLFEDDLLPWVTYFRVENLEDWRQTKEYVVGEHGFCFANKCIEEAFFIYEAIIEYLLRYKDSVTVFMEFSQEYYFLTLVGLEYIPPQVLDNVISLRLYNVSYHVIGHRLSLKIPKEFSEQESLPKDKSEGEAKMYDSILRKTHTDKISASVFMNDLSLDVVHKLENMLDVFEKMELMINELSIKPSLENLYKVVECLQDYRNIVFSLMEFSEIVEALDLLIAFLKEIPEDSFKEKQSQWELAIDMLFALNSDFEKWQQTIFVDKEANDIHYLDASLLSSIYQIKDLFEEEALEEEDIEFF